MTDNLKAKKEKDIIAWYNEVLIKAKVVDFSSIKGFSVYMPYGYKIWEIIQEYLDKKFKEIGVENAYFPSLIPEHLLSKEEQHIKHFSVEAAWVTMGGDKKLDERLAIRPTSETIIYDSLANWIKSYRDLPVMLNQWVNIVRWETKETRFFLRGREFLWQEGHCVFRTDKEADKNALQMVKIYKEFMETMMAVPVFLGLKSEREKFAGADRSYTIETFLPGNYASQVATSHDLGTNFSKPFEIKFLNEKNEWEYAYQTSWGISIRAIGEMILTFGDDKGLVIPPKVAPIQVVVIPILEGKEDSKILSESKRIERELLKEGIRVKLDDSVNFSPGWKFNEYELKGVPLRLEIGAKEIADKEITYKVRFNGERGTIKSDALSSIAGKLDEIQSKMLNERKKKMMSTIKTTTDRDEFLSGLKQRTYIFKAAWCGAEECEDKIEEETGASSRLISIDDEGLLSDSCIYCGKKAVVNAYFSQSF
ncbi:MAG: proline--tRNA ligase [Candidatus Parvarchaeota archaeon]|nr:proline--tRNA ligase [Candidatus Parvarchaeota archaeon]